MQHRSLIALRACAAAGALVVGVPALSGQKFTPPPPLESIAPTPAAPDSYQRRLVATMAPYVPDEQVSGVLRLWGHGNAKLPWMRHLVALWEEGFRKFQPGVTFDYQMHGTSSGIPALFTGLGDVAILGEEILPASAAAFEKVKHYPPLGIEILTGSVDVRNFDYAQQFFVHQDNPLAHVTLAQLDAVFGAQHRRGVRYIRTWGQLGLKGAWADKPITPYGWAIDDSFGAYLQQYLLGGSHEWNCALLDCAAIRISPVPYRLDSDARFALPLRAPAPESLLLGMHLPHPRAGPGHHNRPAAGEDPPTAGCVLH